MNFSQQLRRSQIGTRDGLVMHVNAVVRIAECPVVGNLLPSQEDLA